ncbi:MAG: IS1 family transposase [Candidatus Electrothrix sp. YB6]
MFHFLSSCFWGAEVVQEQLYSDDICRKYFPASKHIFGKADTWKIERRNLKFRMHLKCLNRKTICFSKDDRI